MTLGLFAMGCPPPSTGAGLGEPCTNDLSCSTGLACIHGDSGPKCQVQVDSMSCEPGTAECDGRFLLRCGEDGRSLVFEEVCVSGCSEGVCHDQSCTPGDVRCEDGYVSHCSNDGRQWLPVERCTAGCEEGFARCGTGVCSPGSRRCMGSAQLDICNDTGTGWIREDCEASNGRCVGGIGATNAARCVPTMCAPGARRCDGDRLLRCDDGARESVEELCPSGCDAGGCLEPLCTPGTIRCDGGALFTCRTDGRGLEFVQHCTTGCDEGSNAPSCLPQVCSPLAARCGSGGPERCRADGSGWEEAGSCEAGTTCVNGSCSRPPSLCQVGERRCAGQTVEGCRSDGGITGWNTEFHCVSACVDGACEGVESCRPFQLGVALLEDAEALPADGRSTALVVSSLLQTGEGTVVPDGTLVTVALDPGEGATTPAALVSGDARADLAGLQVPVRDGRFEVLIRSPKLESGSVAGVLRARLHSQQACDASLDLTFSSAQEHRFAAQDFSTTRAREPSSVAVWDTVERELRLDVFDGGDGRDGDLIVPQGEVVSLGTRQPNCEEAHGNCRGWPDLVSSGVVAIHDGDRLELEGATAPFDAGTRLLLINLQGEPGRTSATGAWELVTSLGIDDGHVRLTAPVTRHFGEGGNGPEHFEGQLVRVFRIPQYDRVHIAGTVTAPAFDGTDGGVLAFFARNSRTDDQANRITSTGRITMTGRGYRGAHTPPDPQTAWAGEGLAGGLHREGIGSNHGAGGGGHGCGDGVAGAVDPTQPPPGNVNRAYFGSAGSHASSGASSCHGEASPPYGSDNGRLLHLGSGSGSQSESIYRACPQYAECCLEHEVCLCEAREECCHTPATCCTEWQECCTEWNEGCVAPVACVNTYREACRKRLHAPIPEAGPYFGCTCSRYKKANTAVCGCALEGENGCIVYAQCEHESHGCAEYCGCEGQPLCPCLEGFDGPHPCNNLPPADKPACCSSDDPDACDPWDAHWPGEMCPANPHLWGACPETAPNYPNCAAHQLECLSEDPLGEQICNCAELGPTPNAGCKTVDRSGACVDGPAQCEPGMFLPDETICGCDGFGHDESCDCTAGGWVSDPGCACLNSGRDPTCGCEPRLDAWAAAHAGAPGGGLIFIQAVHLELAPALHSDDARIDASGASPELGAFGGAGGTIHVRAGRLHVGGPHTLRARGGSGGGDGRVFLAAESLDEDFTEHWITPAPRVTMNPPAFARSRGLLPNEPGTIAKARALILPRGVLPGGGVGPASFDPAETLDLSRLQLRLSADGGDSLEVVDEQGVVHFTPTLPPFRGHDLLWELTPRENAIPRSVRSIAIRAIVSP